MLRKRHARRLVERMPIDSAAARRAGEWAAEAFRAAPGAARRAGEWTAEALTAAPSAARWAGGQAAEAFTGTPGTARRAGRQATDAFTAAPALWVGLGALAAIVVGGLLSSARWRRRTVDAVMIGDVVTIEPTATLREAAERMRETNVGMLPIIAGERLRGVITDRDIVVRAVARGMDPATTRVGECATTEPICALPDWDVDDALRVMADCQIGRLPVVDDTGRLVGVVTLSSLALRSRENQETLETAQAVSKRSARAA